MYDIYYAHHRWKYGTEIEKYELDLIKRRFPHANICNPATEIDTADASEDEIMSECLHRVNNSDILVFSSVDGCTGIGVFKEVTQAISEGKIVFYIYQGELKQNFDIIARPIENRSDRIYADVYI